MKSLDVCIGDGKEGDVEKQDSMLLCIVLIE